MSAYRIPEQHEVDRMIAESRAHQSRIMWAAISRFTRRMVSGLVVGARMLGQSFVAARWTEELSNLSDRQLADLGIRRDQIPQMVEKAMRGDAPVANHEVARDSATTAVPAGANDDTRDRTDEAGNKHAA